MSESALVFYIQKGVRSEAHILGKNARGRLEMLRRLEKSGDALIRSSEFEYLEIDIFSESILPQLELQPDDAEKLDVISFAVAVSIEFETNAKVDREKHSEIAVRDSKG